MHVNFFFPQEDITELLKRKADDKEEPSEVKLDTFSNRMRYVPDGESRKKSRLKIIIR